MLRLSRTGPGVFTIAMTGKNFATIADAFAFLFFIAGLFALFICAYAASLSADAATGVRVFSLGLLIAGASTVVGWLLGLLFGIPRTLSRPLTVAAVGPGSTTTASAPTSRVNTNLEDVSDWLTKTLIGVGLTQLYLVPGKIWHVSEVMNTSGFGWHPHGALLGAGLILYFTPGGFWLGYVATRTILTKLFDSVDEAGAEAEIVLVKDQLQLSVVERAVASATDPEVVRADRALLRMPMHAMNTPRQLAAWGVAKARAGQLALGTLALEEARDADPSDESCRDALAKLYTIQDRVPEAESLLRDAPVNDLAVLWALYEDSPAGFTRAIEIGEGLLKTGKQKDNVNLQIWLACAYGQQHASALAAGDAGLVRTARDKVIAHVEAAVALDARARPLIVSLWKPAPGSAEDDLATIPGGDPDMVRLLTP